MYLQIPGCLVGIWSIFNGERSELREKTDQATNAYRFMLRACLIWVDIRSPLKIQLPHAEKTQCCRMWN
ncbi:MAG: hypothetical protein ACK5XN_22275, partial [Bacteroidota bacterium]